MVWVYNKQTLCWEASEYGWHAVIVRVPERHAYMTAIVPFDMPDRIIRANHVFSELRDAQSWCAAEIAHRRLDV